MAQRIISSAAIKAWLQTLDQVDRTIANSLRDLEEQEQAIAASRLDDAGTIGAGEQRFLEQLDERVRTLQQHIEAADDTAAQVEELLAEDEQQSRAWLAAAATAERKLAAAAMPGI